MRLRLRQLGYDPARIGTRELLGLLRELVIEQHTSVWAEADKVRAAVDETLDDPSGLLPKGALRRYKLLLASAQRSTWGLDGEARAAAKAAQALMGGPALPRPTGRAP